MTRRVGVLLLPLLVAMIGVSGCVAVPTDGPVVEGRPAGEPVPPPNVAVLPTGPRSGDSPVAIVEGFLSSMASYEPGYPTAREYLTPQAALAWRPESGIAVYGAGEGSRNLSATDEGAQISLALVAQVGEDGSYTPAEADARLVLDLSVTQVGDEWRIDSPPDGLVMTEFDFTREFTAVASYFFDPTFEVLVPDLTYLPIRGNLPTLLVEELLDGPTDWLDPGVRTAINPGVRLSSGSVVLAGTRARVDLTEQVASAPADQRDWVAAQLAWTLRQAPGVAEVQVLAEGQPVSLPSSPTGIVSAEDFAFYDPAAVPAGSSLFAVSDGRVVGVEDEIALPVDGPLGDAGSARSVAVNLTGTRGAAIVEDGTSVSVAGLSEESRLTTLTVGEDLAVPSFDRRDRLWLVDRSGQASRVLVLDASAGADPAAVAVPVAADALDQVQVERLQIAPDGVRAAAVYRSETGGRLLLALVLRGDDGQPRLGQVRDVALEQVEATDVAWASATALALLGVDEGEPQPYLVELSNSSLSSRGQVDGAVALAASPGQPLVLGTVSPPADTGEDEQEPGLPVLVRQDALQEWVPLVQATAPTYPG